MKQLLMTAIFFQACVCLFSQTPASDNRVMVMLQKEFISASYSNTNDDLNNATQVKAISEKYHTTKIEKLALGRNTNEFAYIFTFPSGADIHKIVSEFNQTGEAAFAEPDFIGTGGGVQGVVPDDQFYNRQWALHNNGSFTLSPARMGADIDMQQAWEIQQGDSNIVVAIIDSGTKLDHPEFSGRIWVNKSEIPDNGIDDDNNGYIDDFYGWDFANDDNLPTDDLGHGTNVAGIIGANGNNSLGYAGVDWHCKLMNIKALNSDNSGFYSWWIGAIYYAVDNGAHAINMSMGGTSNSDILNHAIAYALANNVTVVACMMNTNSNTIFYPAACDGVIAVGSTNPNDTRSNPFFWNASSGSNFGNHISVTAPGNYIYGLNHNSGTNYGTYWGGTSQATPMVTGLAALLLAQNNDLTPVEIKSIIETTAEDQVGKAAEDTPGWDIYHGHGRANAFQALSSLLSSPVNNYQLEDVWTYPNPASSAFTVHLPAGNWKVQVVNLYGSIVMERKVKGQTNEHFCIEHSGVYFIRALSDAHSVSKKILIHP